MSTPLLIIGYCLAILLASLAGGWIPLMVRLTHTRLEVASSFISGLMLGVGLLHLLPHAYFEIGSIDRAMHWLMAGFLFTFLIQRFFHHHMHGLPMEAGHEEHAEGPHSCEGHEHPPHPAEGDNDRIGKRWSWLGAGLGLTLHTLINGMVLAASIQAESEHQDTVAWAGFGTFLVIFLHKPFDAWTLGTLMSTGGWSRFQRHLVNAVFALVIPLGVLLFMLGFHTVAENNHQWVGCALAFAAGTFLCIASIDLLPELQFHKHDRFKLSMALALGIGLAVMVGQFESHGHDHHQPAAGVLDDGHDHGQSHEAEADHDHDHDH